MKKARILTLLLSGMFGGLLPILAPVNALADDWIQIDRVNALAETINSKNLEEAKKSVKDMLTKKTIPAAEKGIAARFSGATYRLVWELDAAGNKIIHEKVTPRTVTNPLYRPSNPGSPRYLTVYDVKMWVIIRIELLHKH